MALSGRSMRVRAEHREVLQAVAQLLRSGKESTLRKLLDDARARPVGPFRNEAAAPAFLRDRLVCALKPRAIWHFGSRARGTAREDSDFDLLVVLPDGLPAKAYSDETVADPVTGCGLGYDIVSCSWSDFLKDRDELGSLVNRAVTEGRLIYRDRILRAAERTA